jgi:beta-glucosidase
MINIKVPQLLLLVTLIVNLTACKETKRTEEMSSAEVRSREVLAQLSFEEKLKLTGGNQMLAPGVKRLGLAEAQMADASQGVRLHHPSESTNTEIDQVEGVSGNDIVSVSFPGMMALAATWNPKLAEDFGEAMGGQCRSLGIDILLGPGINMYRSSAGGRAYEYMGEDPLLTSSTVVEYIKGVQSQGVVATAKHFVANDMEFCRHFASTEVDMRTLREVYLPPFRSAVQEAKVGALMTGNNRVNGLPAPIHKPLMQDIVRDEWGFNGMTMSDWQQTNYYKQHHDLVLESGHSLYMPQGKNFQDWLTDHYQKQEPEQHDVIEKQLDEMVVHNLIPLFESGFFDRGNTEASYSPMFEDHRKVAQKTAEEAITLLKNEDQILPIKKGAKILYIGKDEIFTGFGSGKVIGYNNTSYSKGLQAVYGDDITILDITKVTSRDYKNADVVIYNINKNGGEGRDLPFNLEIKQTREIESVLNAHSNVVLLISACNGFNMPWLSKAKGVLWCYFLGQERGFALANIVSGKTNPSGKLPMTIEKDFSDSVDPEYNYIGGQPFWRGSNIYREYIVDGVIPENAPKDMTDIFMKNVKPGEILKIPYNEGLHMGYKWFDKQKIEPHFPFGYGLSYTAFKYGNIEVEETDNALYPVLAKVTVSNIGSTAGKEIIQVYVSDLKSSIDQVEKELGGYLKVALKAGETKVVEIPLHWMAFEFFDVITNKWVLEPGEFIIKAGGSSVDLPLIQKIELLTD